MKYETIVYKGNVYPEFQTKGFASQFAFPFAKQLCKGVGYDIGCMKKEWALEGSIPIDISFDGGYHALNLPHQVDYIFSSHCLEHIPNWVEVLDYWHSKLNDEGTLFLYLPHYSQEYWRPWNNRKHVNILTPEIMTDYMNHKDFKNVFSGGPDLNSSFMIVGHK